MLHSPAEGDIHFNLYVPEAANGAAGQTAPATTGGRDLASSTAAGASSFAPPAPSASPNATMPAAFTDPEPAQPAALFVTLPGYQGLYFQGVGENLRTEDFGFEAQAYDPSMIVVAPQLSDWGETSARQTIALIEWLLRAYNVDVNRVFLEGYSGGGETLSQIMGMRPELFRAALHCSSQWDGNVDALAGARVPVRLVIGESDEYYGANPARRAADQMRAAYRAQGLAESEIDKLVVLDVKPASYFAAGGVANQHGGGGALFSRDPEIMGWLFEQ